MDLNPVKQEPSNLTEPRGAIWDHVAKFLREHPFEWYSFPEIGPKRAVRHTVRRGNPKAFQPPGTFDMVNRDGKAVFRYVGEPVRPWDPQGLKTGEQDQRTFEEVIRSARCPGCHQTVVNYRGREGYWTIATEHDFSDASDACIDGTIHADHFHAERWPGRTR